MMTPTSHPDAESLVRSGAALREAIRRADLSYEAVAHRLGLKGRSSVAQWCSGSVAVPVVYHAPLRVMLRVPYLFPETAMPMQGDGEHAILLALLDSFARVPEFPMDVVERTGWDVWSHFVRRADWFSAGKFVDALQEAITHWRLERGQTTRRVERLQWAAAHAQIRSALSTRNWEQVETQAISLRRNIYRSRWLEVLDHSEQALVLNSLCLGDFFLHSRLRKIGPDPVSRRVPALRQALTAAMNHLGEANRRLRLPQEPAEPPASQLRLGVARLLLDATELSMIYEAREDASVAQTLVLLAERAAEMAAGAPHPVTAANAMPDGAEEGEPITGEPAAREEDYRTYIYEEILPRIELECRFNAAVIGALEPGIPDSDRAAIARSTHAMEQLAEQVPDSRFWHTEIRMTELFHILRRVLSHNGPIPRDDSLELRHRLGDLREDFDRNALMGQARSAACLEILLDVNLSQLTDTSAPEREERLQSAAEIVDWMDSSVESQPDAPTHLVVHWDRGVLALLGGIREASTVRDLIEVYQRFTEYGGRRIPRDAARFIRRIASGEFGARAAAAVPASLRETLPPAKQNGDRCSMILILAPLLYPMMPIHFFRPQGYVEPSTEFWAQAFPIDDLSMG